MTAVRLDHITKRFGTTVALDDIDLEIKAGELFFLLGPSGCGKSTLLRLIAGLHDPNEGRIFFNDRDVTALQTDKRNAVMCFQSYALWPHMSVRDNIRFGLEIRKLDRAHQKLRIEEVLKLVRMEELADRKPNQLSGGQQQLVGVARAIVANPAVILADEPTGNLHSSQAQEIMELFKRLNEQGTTIVQVTHSETNASYGSRIIRLRDGYIQES